MAGSVINLGWFEQSSSPIYDGNYKDSERPPISSREAIMLALGVDVNPVATGTTYYVNSSTGSDANPGTQAQPWLTMTFSLAQLTAGDELIVQGTYSNEVNMTTTNSGTVGNPIIIRGDATTRPSFTGSDFYFITKSYIVVDNMEFSNSTESSVRTNTNCSNIHTFNCYMHDLDTTAGRNIGGVRYDSQTDGAVYNCYMDNIRVAGALNENAAGILGYGMNGAVAGFNTIKNCQSGIYLKTSVQVNSQISLGNDIDAVYAYYAGVIGGGAPSSNNLEFYNNYCRDGGVFLKVHETATQSEELLIRNNLFTDVMFEGRGMDKIRSHSNIGLAARQPGLYAGCSFLTQLGGSALTTVYESDYNDYPNVPGFTLDQFGASEEIAVTLSSLRLKVIGDGNGTIQVNNPDANSIETTPTFDGDNIATNLTTSGKGGGAIGLEYAVGSTVEIV